MNSDDDFDGEAYKAFEDQLYGERSSSGSEDDLDSDIEETLYGHVHYASSLLVSENSTPVSGERTSKRTNEAVKGLDTKQEKHHSDNSVIEISSDDGEDSDDDDDYDDNENMDTDDCMNRNSLTEDIKLSSSYNYPEVLNLFSDESIPTSKDKTSKESALVQNEAEPGEITENWDLNKRDLEDSTVTKQRPRYYTPGKGLAHVKCYNCNEKGHLSQYCPEPKKISVCFLCGDVGHVKRFCPNDLCFNCREPGHKSKDCRKPRRRRFDRCKRCYVFGHLAIDCPDRWRQYHLTTQVGPIVRPDRPISPPQSISCYNCGNQGHYGHECLDDNATRREELPLPFVVCYDGCQVSSSGEKWNYNKPTLKRRSRNERHHQPMSEGFYDKPRQQEYDMDTRVFRPPPEKMQKFDNNGDVRRVSFHDDSYQASNFDNSPYSDRKRNKKKKNKDETSGRNERIVEILDHNLLDDGLIEEPYQGKRKKAKKHGKQHWRGGDSFDDGNFDNRKNINARNNSQQRNDRRFSDPRHKEDYRHNYFNEGQFDSRRTPFKNRMRGKSFTSGRGFRYNSETRGKKSNPQYLKRYTF